MNLGFRSNHCLNCGLDIDDLAVRLMIQLLNEGNNHPEIARHLTEQGYRINRTSVGRKIKNALLRPTVKVEARPYKPPLASGILPVGKLT